MKFMRNSERGEHMRKPLQETQKLSHWYMENIWKPTRLKKKKTKKTNIVLFESCKVSKEKRNIFWVEKLTL